MNKRLLFLAILVVALAGVGAYYYFNRPPAFAPSARPLPIFPEKPEPVASGGQPSIRWIANGEGAWEDPHNWAVEADGGHRLPGPEDDVIIPTRVANRNAIVQITDSTPKRVRTLVNHGIIMGVLSEKNPNGSIVLEVEGEFLNYGRIESSSTTEGEPSAIIIKASRFRNERTLDVGTSQGKDQPGGRIELEAANIENKGELYAGNAWNGPGGAVIVRASFIHNAGVIRGGRGGRNAKSPPRSAGDVMITASEALNQYNGQICGGKSFTGTGGSVRLSGREVNHMGGVIRGGDGVEEGSVSIVAQKMLLITGSKSSINGYHLELSAPQISLNGLATKSIQAQSTESGVASIKITACERLNLSNNREKIILNVPQGGEILFNLPTPQAIILDRGMTLEALIYPAPTIASEPCP